MLGCVVQTATAEVVEAAGTLQRIVGDTCVVTYYAEDSIYDVATVGEDAVLASAGAVEGLLSASIHAVPVHLEANAIVARSGGSGESGRIEDVAAVARDVRTQGVVTSAVIAEVTAVEGEGLQVGARLVGVAFGEGELLVVLKVDVHVAVHPCA